jgi:adenylate cyclase
MGSPPLQDRRGMLFILIGAISALIAIVAYATGLMHSLEYSSMDKRFQVRGERKPPDDLVVVGLDEKSFTELRSTSPLPRSLHAEAIDKLAQAGASQIAYDIQFTEPTDPKDDNALVAAVGRADHMVLATTEVDEQGHTSVLGGDATVAQQGARAGYSAFDAPGGVFRVVEIAPDKLDSFAVATVEARTGSEVTPDQLPDGAAWIDYYGGPGTFPIVSLSDVIHGELDPATFRGKTVVVGATASNLQDLHPHPFGDGLMSGAEIQANAIETVARDAPLRSTPLLVDLLLIAALALLAAVLNMLLSPLRAFALVAGAALLYLVFAQVAFNGGRIVPVVYPLMGLTIASVGSLAAQYIFAAFDRQRTRDTFARFVPDPVIDRVLAQSDGVRLGGTREEVTVLFSDIRGFTTFSESRSPEEVIEILNRYFGEMTAAILDNGGTLSAFIGDGIMAVFGAPVEQDDHAERALRAAREMLGPRLEAFNDWAAEAKRGKTEPFRMGVGLNSGPVMVGMVGSERRLEYTAIGDTVNAASRLEGMTKGTPHSLFVAESTRQRLLDSMDELEFVEEMQVRGRAHGIKVFTDPHI